VLRFIIDQTNSDLTSTVIHNFVLAWYCHTVVFHCFSSPLLFIVWLLSPSFCAVIASVYCYGLPGII